LRRRAEISSAAAARRHKVTGGGGVASKNTAAAARRRGLFLKCKTPQGNRFYENLVEKVQDTPLLFMPT
jgi:hypothetical protein